MHTSIAHSFVLEEGALCSQDRKRAREGGFFFLWGVYATLLRTEDDDSPYRLKSQMRQCDSDFEAIIINCLDLTF